MFSFHTRATDNLPIYLQKFKPCKILEDNLLANEKFTSCYNL